MPGFFPIHAVAPKPALLSWRRVAWGLWHGGGCCGLLSGKRGATGCPLPWPAVAAVCSASTAIGTRAGGLVWLAQPWVVVGMACWAWWGWGAPPRRGTNLGTRCW